ncbi:MAG: hypothetical protein DCC71_24275 [Proteobacteria bacterium]|nr:MAG: hypothetical protein DCC71_24275 [Pseudomonadota bacterium]
MAIAVAWAIPGPVPALVARQDAVLLGRYAVGHFAALAVGTIALGVAAALLASRRSLAESALLAAIAALSTFAGVVAIASVARETIAPRYVAAPVASAVADPALRARLAGRVLTRQPDYRWEVVREDRPAPGRSYPKRVPGRPAQSVVLTTDDRGLRNAPRAGTYDVVVAGDSFTEGSMVSDDQTWWAVAARAAGLRIYNTAVSGLSIREYLNHWAAFGLDTGARTLVVTVYEGNDWKPLGPAKRAAWRPPRVRALRAGVFDFAWGDSPLRWRAEQALVQLLAPIGADRPLAPNPGLDWMPAAVESGGVVRHYAFEPKHMMRLDWDPDAFRAAPEWTTNEAVLREIAALARERGVRLVVAYAPVKPHVVLPLVRERVSAEALRGFAAFRSGGRPLPEPAAFRDRLYARLDVQEHALRDWCAEQGVAFASLTAPLRDAMARGVPVFFTYDPHWTEEGHAVVAEALAPLLAAPR